MSTQLTTWTNTQLRALFRTALLCHNLQKQVLHTPDGSPLAYVDPPTIQENYYDLPPEEAHPNDVHDALLPLTHHDGYPSTPNGTPFWERLENEPQEYYDLFRIYRDDTYLKSLQTAQTQNQNPGRYPVHAPEGHRSRRTITAVADRTDTDRDVVKTLALLYHWYSRAAEYDKFNQKQLELRKQAEIAHMENTHRNAAQQIFNTAMEYFEEHKDELNPKTALELLQTAVELERLSLGMPKDKPQQDHETQIGGDRRPWVQINQQYNQNPNENTSGSSNSEDSLSSGTREARITTILRTLQNSGAIDFGEGEVIDIDSHEGPKDDESSGGADHTPND